MKYKPENVKLAITHDNVEQEIEGVTDYPVNVDNPPPKKKKDVKSYKSSRCKYTIDWVEEEYGDAYVNKESKKDSQSCKQSSQSCKQNTSSTLVKQLTKSEIESLRQNKRDAYALMMKMD